MTVYSLREAEIHIPKSGTITLKKLLKTRQYDIVYIMLGINELGHDFDQNVEVYQALLDHVRETQPDAIVILMANIRVTGKRSSYDSCFNNPAVDRFNEAVSQMADYETVFYLDANHLFDDGNGNLSEEKARDTIHLNSAACVEWAQWIMEQTVEILQQTVGVG